LGIVVGDRETGLALSQPDLTDAAFRLEVATRLVRVPDGSDPWLLSTGGTQLQYVAEVAVAWLHLQGLRTDLAGWSSAASLLDLQFGADRPLLRDGAPYNTLERLSTWLGVAAFTTASTGQSGRLIPDPTPIVSAALSTLIPDTSVSASDFMARTGEMFPWLPHGKLGRAVATHMREVPDASDSMNRASEGLSLALLRLGTERRLELDPGDDPRSRVLFSVGETERGIARIVRR
jgi:hypothetical protein